MHFIVVLLSGNTIVESTDYKWCYFFVFKDKGIFSLCVDMVIAKLYFGTILIGISPLLFLCICQQKKHDIAAPGLVACSCGLMLLATWCSNIFQIVNERVMKIYECFSHLQYSIMFSDFSMGLSKVGLLPLLPAFIVQ